MKKYRYILLIIAFILLATIVFPSNPAKAEPLPPTIDQPASVDSDSSSIQFIGCGPVYLQAVNAAFEQQVVELVNIERSNAGLPPLKRSDALEAAARYHAKDMAVDQYFSHDSYDAGNIWVCNCFTRMKSFYPGGGWMGENIAAGFSTPASVMEGWMDSQGHRENILNPHYREIGVGYYAGGPWSHYWVQDFGEQSNSYPIVIDQEKAVTEVPQVELYLYGEGTWNEMRLKNDSDAWSEWKPFAENVQWQLDWVQGIHTVSVELRASGQTYAGASASDNIELTTSGSELGNLPDTISYVYNLKTHELLPGIVELQPLNVRSDSPIEWQVTNSSGWIEISNTNGTTPDGRLLIQPAEEALRKIGEYMGSFVVGANSDIQVLGSPKEITVRLIVVECLDNQVFLPTIQK